MSSMPTNRPITHKPETGHCASTKMPSISVITPLSTCQPQSGNEALRVTPGPGKLAELDGLVFVTPEYNHGYSAVLKNALDYAYQAYNRKPAAFVGYGGVGAARAIEQLRMVAVELQMAPIPKSVNVGMTEFLGIWQQCKDFADFPHLEQAAVALLDDLSWWSRTLQIG